MATRRPATLAVILWLLSLGVPVTAEEPSTYVVNHIDVANEVSCDWDHAQWNDMPILKLPNFMGDRPDHMPVVQAKCRYDEEAIYIIFRVDDRFVRAVAETHQDNVFEDSCVEFFFTPGDDVSIGYFNLEMNCGGTMLFHYQRVPRQDAQPLSESDLEQVTVKHSLPNIVDPEMASATTWTVAYRLPFAILEKYCPGKVAHPKSGVKWRANFYKCADKTSHPHWLTWSKIDLSRPDFHRPDYFGTLSFE